MSATRGGFRRCPRCGTMQGPVPACPACGWAEGCAWCQSRVWIPGSGWTISPAYPDAVSHGMCPWCATTSYGAPIQKVATAAERLRVSAGLLEVSACRLHDGSRYVTITDGRRCGWAGRVEVCS